MTIKRRIDELEEKSGFKDPYPKYKVIVSWKEGESEYDGIKRALKTQGLEHISPDSPDLMAIFIVPHKGRRNIT